MDQAPPYNAQNFAYIVTAGPYENKDVPSVYYIAPPDPRWTPEEQAQYVSGESTLLLDVGARGLAGALPALPARQPQPVEGGAAVPELRVHGRLGALHRGDDGRGRPACRQSRMAHIGQLLSALKRNARYVSAIGLHTQGMTVAESETLFRDGALQDPGNARQQALRGTYDPAYLNYTLGKLMILKLRADWMATHGGKASLREFHDTFLSYGGPLPLTRRLMLGDAAGDPL